MCQTASLTQRIRFLIPVVLLLLLFFTQQCETKKPPKAPWDFGYLGKPWLGFLQRPAHRLWQTVVGLYDAADVWEREVTNPRLKKLHSNRPRLRDQFKEIKRLAYNGSVSNSINMSQEGLPPFKFGQKDVEFELQLERFVNIVGKYGNQTYEQIKKSGDNTTAIKEVIDKIEQNPQAFNLTGLKDLMRRVWFMIPRKQEFEKEEGKPWIVEPKSFDPANPNYDPRRLKIKKRWRKLHKDQGQIWRIVKQKKERLKQKKLDSRRATIKKFKADYRSFRMWMWKPEPDYVLDEELVCERNKDKFQDWESYKKILHEKVKQRKKLKKKKKKLLKKALRKLITPTIRKTKRTWKGFTRRSKDPYTGTRIIGRKERDMLRKERRRVRNRLKRKMKTKKLLKTGVDKVKSAKSERKAQQDHLDIILEELEKNMTETRRRIQEAKEREEEEKRQRLLTTIKINYSTIQLHKNLTNRNNLTETKFSELFENISTTVQPKEIFVTTECLINVTNNVISNSAIFNYNNVTEIKQDSLNRNIKFNNNNIVNKNETSIKSLK